MLSVRDLRKSYGETVALDGVDLDIAAGEIVALLGENGAGKTTLVSIVAGLRRADAGRATVNGVDVSRDPVRARRFLGLAPQELGFYPSISVLDNLRFFGELADLRGAVLRRRIEEVADALDMERFIDRPAHSLSGGEKRRLHTALAMLHRPPLLLLDEPTTGVDVRTRTKLLDVVRSLAADGSAVCYSTHYLAEVEAMDAAVAILDRGRIIASGPVRQLVRHHGESALELTFDRPAPRLARLPHRREATGNMVRIFTAEPAAEAPAVLAALGSHSRHLLSMELVGASLESVFLSLTGRRYEQGGQDGDDGEGPDGVGGDGHGGREVGDVAVP